MADGAPATARQRSVLATQVVGRDRELATLRDAVEAATHGRGSVVFLVGEAGIGKSRLAQVVAGDAEERGLRVLRGRAVPTSTPVAYRPLTEALSAAVRAGTAPDAAELAPFDAPLGRIVPAWREADAAELDDSMLVLAEGVLRFLRGVARSAGCVVVMEDLHWADAETLAILEYLADNVADEHIVCIATARDERPSPGLDLARTLHARRASNLIELHRLSDVHVAEMLEACLGSDGASSDLMALADRADGVPFLVEELLAVAVASGALVHSGASWTLSPTVAHVVPMTFVDSVRRRLVALGDDARTALAGAAILGRRFDWELLAPMTGLDESAVVTALHAAVDTQIVAVDQGAFRFRHALSRDAVLSELLPPQRARLSARALEAIERTHPDLPGHWCELAADVAEGAGDRGRAAALLLEAGRRALGDGALMTAETTLERARVLAPARSAVAVDVEECLITVLALAGKRDRAVEVGESLLHQLARGAPLAARRAEAHLRLARAQVVASRWAEADDRLARAAAEAAGLDDDALRARIDVVAAQAAIVRRPEDAAGLARGALDVAERLDLPDVACEALEVIGRFERRHDLDAAEAAFARAHDTAAERGLAVWRVRALHELATVDLLRGGNLDRFEQAREQALALGALSTVAILDVQVSAALAIGDDPERSVAVARRAAELARRYRLGAPLAAALAFEAVAHARAGRRGELERCLAEASDHGDRDFDVLAEFARALLALVEEDRVAAHRHLDLMAIALPDASGDQATGPAAGLLALLLAVDGRDLEHRPAQEPVHFLARGLVGHAGAVLAGRAGDVDAALGALLHGREALANASWFRHVAARLVAEAALADGWGDPAAWLSDALRFFDRNGDERLASACRSLLRRAGAPVPRRRAEPSASSTYHQALGFTAREVEVLRLLGEGLSNKDIGSRLYLSPRTVERHVASLTAKAGVSRRSELIAFAARSAGPD